MNEISQSKQHLECIFDSITTPIFSVSEDYTITRLNKSYESLSGKTFQEILGNPCYEGLYKRSSRCPGCPLGTVLSEGQSADLRIDMEEGTIYAANCFPLKEKDGTIIAMVEVARNVTEEEHIREELAELQQQTLMKSLELAAKNEELNRAYIKIHRELELAQLVQQGIMPQELPEFHELNTGFFYLPMEEVGGDLYDFIQITPDMLGVIIVDVSGHGIPAAFIAAMTKMAFYLHAHNSTSTARVLSQVNQDMCHNLHTDEHFFTTAYCLIDLITNRIKCSNAGHPPLLILRKATSSLEEINEKSIIMGINADAKYQETEIPLKKGDRLVFYTDGIFECISESKDYGFNRFCDILLKTASLPVSEQVESVKMELKEYIEGEFLTDDVTLVIIELAMDSKFEYFSLGEQFSNPETVTIRALRHPLEFEKVISDILHVMDHNFFHDQSIRNTKFAVYEALNMYYHSRWNDKDPIYIAFSCTKKKCSIVIVDSRFLKKDAIEKYSDSQENKSSIEILKKNMDSCHFLENGKKIVLEKINS